MKIQDMSEAAQTAEGSIAHWADNVADKVIRYRCNPDGSQKDSFTCASGITPSGTVHIGNFREIISTELVARSLRQRGKKVRFIYSWDDYDVFRKIPKNMPNQEMLKAHLRWPIVLVPDPFGEEESYARHHEVAVEKSLGAVGVSPEYLYQAKKYMASEYAAEIRIALEKKDEIKAILDEFRTEDLGGDWWPISVFSGKTHRDTTTIVSWDGEWTVVYRDDDTGETEAVDLRKTSLVKLPWRIDWPMRWNREGVDFEPAGKDHHSEGGSWSTAEQVCKKIYGCESPVSFQYDFIKIKGRGGKISSSSGEVLDLNDVLEIYTPELVRYLFAGTRPNAEFAISFDMDVLKIYEDYDKTERYYYGAETIEASHQETADRIIAKEKRIYELSQVKELPHGVLPFMPLQIPFRTFCNLLLLKLGDVAKAIDAFPGTAAARGRGELDASKPAGAENIARLHARAACAWKWIQEYAPEDMRFSLRPFDAPLLEVNEFEKRALSGLRVLAEGGFEVYEDDKDLQDILFAVAKDSELEPKAFFSVVYRVLIGKTQGPRLAGFLKTLGPAHIKAMLAGY